MADAGPETFPLEDDPLLLRYMSQEGAEAYSRKYGRTLMRRLSNWREMALVRSSLRVLGEGGSVLDVPCGAGRLLPVLAERAERVVGVDVSPAMLAIARQAISDTPLGARVHLVEGHVGSLPFADGEFDVAVCWRLLHHLGETVRVRVLSELRRVSRRGVVVSFADAGTIKALVRVWRRRFRRSVSLTSAKLAEEAREAGLRMVSHSRLASAFSHVAAAILRPA